jgi:hypothetical protein
MLMTLLACSPKLPVRTLFQEIRRTMTARVLTGSREHLRKRIARGTVRHNSAHFLQQQENELLQSTQ